MSVLLHNWWIIYGPKCCCRDMQDMPYSSLVRKLQIIFNKDLAFIDHNHPAIPDRYTHVRNLCQLCPILDYKTACTTITSIHFTFLQHRLAVSHWILAWHQNRWNYSELDLIYPWWISWSPWHKFFVALRNFSALNYITLKKYKTLLEIQRKTHKFYFLCFSCSRSSI